MFTTPLGVRPDILGNGTSPRDMRHALAGLVATPGVLSGLTVTGHATEWTYEVAPGTYAAQRPDNGGIVLGANDAPELVGTIPAPGTGSRIDIIYIQTQEEEGSSEAYPWVANGTASGTPVAPTIPVGAMEIARKVVAAGDANTLAGAPITYTNTPQGIVGRPFVRNIGAGKTSTQVDFTNAQGEVNLANVTTGTVVNGKVRATLNATVSASAAPLLIKLIIRTLTGVVIGTGQVRLEAAGGPGQETVSFTVQENVPPGSHTFQVRGQIVSGTGTASLLTGAQLLVDDYR